MFPHLSPLARAAGFYLLAVGMITVVAVSGGSTAVAMVTPLAAALLMLVVVTREGWRREGWAALGLHRPGVRSWPVAVGLPILINVTGAVAMVIAGAAYWQPEGNPAMVPPLLWPVLFAFHIILASVSISLTEEIGWRGYLVPHLAALGDRWTMLLSGLLHGLWHLPIILITDLYLADGNRAVVLPMFVLCAISAGVFLGWLRLRSGSVWPPVLAHSAHNVTIMWVSDALAGDPARMELIGGESGLVVVAGYLVLGVILLVRSGSRWVTPGPAAGSVTNEQRATIAS